MAIGGKRIASLALSGLAGLMGLAHGGGEIAQGATATGGLIVNAVEGQQMPAMTLLPTFQMAGIATVLVAVAVLVWGLGFLSRPRGGLVLLGLAVVLLLVGGGFIPPVLAIGAAAFHLGRGAKAAG